MYTCTYCIQCTTHNILFRPDQINLLLLGDFEQKIGSSDRKEEKVIKWEWLETIIELLHDFVETYIFVTSDRRASYAYLALHFMKRE